MGIGQRNWQPRGSSTNEYIVEVGIEKEIALESEYRTLFGRLNGMRNLNITEIERDGEKVTITGGGESSPLWEKTFGEENREARFTYQEQLTGKLTFGQAPVKTGGFTPYRHEVIHASQLDTPAYPILDRESQYRQSGIIPMSSVESGKKEEIKRYVEKQKEILFFQSFTDGASENYLDTANGGLGLALPGATAGQNRSCYNTWVAGATALTAPNFTRTTHEGTLSTAVAALTDNDNYAFTYETHEQMSWQISALKFPSVKIGNGEYRAACIIDPWALKRLSTSGGTLATKWTYATPRSMANPAIDGLGTIELDGILYIPSMYWQYFRPTANGTTMVYLPSGADPFDETFSNSSNIVCAYYFTSGALLRGRSSKSWFTASGEGQSDAGHTKGTTIAYHWDDCIKRTEWTTKDGRSSIKNDRSLMWFGYDPGPGRSFAA